jgi:hypothetical protein
MCILITLAVTMYLILMRLDFTVTRVPTLGLYTLRIISLLCAISHTMGAQVILMMLQFGILVTPLSQVTLASFPDKQQIQMEWDQTVW